MLAVLAGGKLPQVIISSSGIPGSEPLASSATGLGRRSKVCGMSRDAAELGLPAKLISMLRWASLLQLPGLAVMPLLLAIGASSKAIWATMQWWVPNSFRLYAGLNTSR